MKGDEVVQAVEKASNLLLLIDGRIRYGDRFHPIDIYTATITDSINVWFQVTINERP